jgi:hypothetical protein
VTELLVVDDLGNGCEVKLRSHFLLGDWLVRKILLVYRSWRIGPTPGDRIDWQIFRRRVCDRKGALFNIG